MCRKYNKALGEDFHCNICVINEKKQDSDALNIGSPLLARYYVNETCEDCKCLRYHSAVQSEDSLH